MSKLKSFENTMLIIEYISKYPFKYVVSLFLDLILCILLILGSKTVFIFVLVLAFLLLKIILYLISIIQEQKREYRDLLTGLYNRNYLVNKYLRGTECKKATSLIVLDIDDFSQINSEKGYKYADMSYIRLLEL